jgi:hypothetical protein
MEMGMGWGEKTVVWMKHVEKTVTLVWMKKR